MKSKRRDKTIQPHSKWILCLGIMFGSALPALGHSVVVQPVEDLARRASHVVQAIPVSSEYKWDDEHHFIWTHTTLKVRDSFKGGLAKDSQITVVTVGGTVGNDVLIVPGTVYFAPGEEVVLFLTKAAATAPYRVVDLSAGKFETGLGASGLFSLSRRDLVHGPEHHFGAGDLDPVIWPKSVTDLKRIVFETTGRTMDAAEAETGMDLTPEHKALLEQLYRLERIQRERSGTRRPAPRQDDSNDPPSDNGGSK